MYAIEVRNTKKNVEDRLVILSINRGMIENQKWGTLKNEKQKDFTEGR